MSSTFKNKTIAFSVTDGFDQVELTEPWEAFKGVGAEVRLVSIRSAEVQGVHHERKRRPVSSG